MAVSYTKPPAIPQATWNQVSWSFDTGSNHPVFHGQNPQGSGTESHPIIKTITYLLMYAQNWYSLSTDSENQRLSPPGHLWNVHSS